MEKSGKKVERGMLGGSVFEVESDIESTYFLPALAADLVTLPVASDFSTDLMTPTATVCRMSRTANRPSGGYWEKASTHMG